MPVFFVCAGLIGLLTLFVILSQQASALPSWFPLLGEERFVAGSIGPTGYLPASEDPTLGNMPFRKLVEVFAEQAQGLVEGGVDLITIETAQDILEVKAAIFGARRAFEATGREPGWAIEDRLQVVRGRFEGTGDDLGGPVVSAHRVYCDAVHGPMVRGCGAARPRAPCTSCSSGRRGADASAGGTSGRC